MTSWKSLASWVLILEQELYLLYINLYYKNLGYKIYTTILKNRMQTTLHAIIGENQSAAIKNRTILHTFSTTRYVTDVSHNLNSNLAWTSSWTFYGVGWDFMPFVSLLPFSSLVMETNSFTRWKLRTQISSPKLTRSSPIWTFYPYIQSSPRMSTLALLCITVAEVPVIFTDADTRNKEYKEETMKLSNRFCW